MGFRRREQGPSEQSPAVKRISRLTTPDVFLTAEQSIMAAGYELSKAMSSDDPGFYLGNLEVSLEQALAAVEVLKHRG